MLLKEMAYPVVFSRHRHKFVKLSQLRIVHLFVIRSIMLGIFQVCIVEDLDPHLPEVKVHDHCRLFDDIYYTTYTAYS